jgi:hypothetical protein
MDSMPANHEFLFAFFALWIMDGKEWIESEARTGVPQARASKATIG